MAEFKDTMRQWIRLCSAQFACDKCPIDAIGCIGNVAAMSKTEQIEQAVTAWAAEHPEPVYPTWYDWMASLGLDPDDPITADIAQKLGIEPKEGV